METLQAIWDEAGLPADAFAAAADPELLRETATDHQAALELGITGVPAVRPAGVDAFVTGAQPQESYLRWVERLASGVLDGERG